MLARCSMPVRINTASAANGATSTAHATAVTAITACNPFYTAATAHAAHAAAPAWVGRGGGAVPLAAYRKLHESDHVKDGMR